MARLPRILEPRAAYDLWAERYPPWAHNELMKVEQRAMESMLRPLAVSRALDVGTGTGRYLRVLAAHGVRTVVGIDLSEAMLARARDQSALLIRAEANRLPVASGSFDLVVASLMVGDVGTLSTWAREMARALTLAGSLIYSDFHPSWAERDWRRSFVAGDGRSFGVLYHPHSLEEHRNALGSAGLAVVRVEEPRWQGLPVLAVFHAVKQ